MAFGQPNERHDARNADGFGKWSGASARDLYRPDHPLFVRRTQQTVAVTLTVGGNGGLTNAGSMAHLASAGLWKTIFTS